jgi:hypothetical protein
MLVRDEPERRIARPINRAELIEELEAQIRGFALSRRNSSAGHCTDEVIMLIDRWIL